MACAVSFVPIPHKSLVTLVAITIVIVVFDIVKVPPKRIAGYRGVLFALLND